MAIDTEFLMYHDTPAGKDPDKYSPTLRRYHKLLWSKSLPNGTQLELVDEPGGYLYHISKLGEFHLSSDAISNTYQHVGRMNSIVSRVPSQDRIEFYNLGSTIGGYIVFPRKMVDKKQNINQARGCRPKIRDRLDLTLECIRRHYVNQDSPLSDVLARYKDFFEIFQDFEGYVDFFLLDDLVDGGAVKFMLPFDNFNRDGHPAVVLEYQALMNATMSFLRSRNQRIREFCAKQKS